jgi:hypothetical protein
MAGVNTLPLSFGKVYTKTAAITVARTGETDIASPADATDLRELFEADVNHGGYDTIEYQVVTTSGSPTQVASKILIWETDNAGANARVVRQIAVAAGSAISTSVAGQNGIITMNRADLQDGVKVFVTVTVVTTNCQWNFTIRAGQFEAQ